MYIYQLEINIVKKYPFNIFNYCNIYMSLEEAKQVAKNYLKLISKHNKIKNKDINEFCITQIDLEYSNNFSLKNKTKEKSVIFLIITPCGSIYVRLVFSIFLILPLIKVGVTLENSHINSSFCFKLSSNCISCLIIFITDTILSWMIFLPKKIPSISE